ncbi:MAG: hypothetical protein PWQ85_1014 [Geotoga sp.]|jgi:glycosyltransferase involved in cell wall biosynthesis|nr:hypothetical protein [Geotoga sp.]
MKKKIWLWNHYATEMYVNRGGRHYWFAKNLIKKGYEATIFCANTFHNKKEFIDTGNKKYVIKTVDNIPFVFVKTTPAQGNGFDRIKNMSLFYLNLFPVAKEYSKLYGKPDIILASSVHPLTLVAGIKVSNKFGVPCICEVRDLWPEAIFWFGKIKEKSLLGKILVAMEHWIYRKADAIVFTKEGDVDYIKEKGWNIEQGGNIDLKKVHYINNGVDIEEFDKLKNEKILDDVDLNSNKFKVIYAGSIRPVNDVGKIIDAAFLLKNEKDILFLIFGEGNQKEILEKRIEEEKITNVKIKGYVNKQYIPYILSKSSVNILNYSQSKFNWSRGNSSNKLFEYMASGKPIISTVKMGYSIINKYKCGLELEEYTAENLAKAILKIKNMSKDEYERLGKNAREGAKDFDFKILTDKLINVIEKL